MSTGNSTGSNEFNNRPLTRQDLLQMLAQVGNDPSKLDLSYQNFDVPFLDLERVNLQKARLPETRLQGANLQGTNLQGADLEEANLQGADLYGADLQRAILPESYQPAIGIGNQTLKILLLEEPLTATTLITVVSSITELYTKLWLIAQERYTDLMFYTQTHDTKFTKKQACL
jgi:uncharacterized protein YjbI with pentapeptide repeats